MKQKNILVLPLALFVLILVNSCASTSKASEECSTEAKKFETNPEKGVVYIYRPGRAVGAAGSIQVKTNGIDAGGTGPGPSSDWN